VVVISFYFFNSPIVLGEYFSAVRTARVLEKKLIVQWECYRDLVHPLGIALRRAAEL